MAQKLKALKITVLVDAKGAVKGIKTAKGEVLSLGTAAEGAGKRSRGLGSAFRGITPMMLGAGGAIVALTAGFKAAISSSIELEKGLREVGTLMGGLTKDEMAAMGKGLKILAVSSGQAIDKLVKAKYDIISAGFADAAKSAKVLAVATDLAVGGVSDVATAADLLTTTLNAYGIAAEKSTDVSDKLFTTVKLGKTTVGDMAGSLGRVLGVAGTLGVGLDELLGSFATLTTTMGSSERATTSLMGGINAMAKPTESLKMIISELGFSSATTMLRQQGFAESIRAVKEKADELNIPLTDVFSSIEALQGILPLTGTSADALARNIDALGDSFGATDEAVKEMEKSTSVQLARMKQAFAVIALEVGEVFIPIIGKAAEAIANLLKPATDNIRISIAGLEWELRELQRRQEESGHATDEQILRMMELRIQIEALKKGFSDLGDTEEITKEVIDDITQALEAKGVAAGETGQRITQISISTLEQIDAEREAYRQMIQDKIAGFNEFFSAIGQIGDNLLNLRMTQIQNEMNAEIEAALNSTESEEWKTNKIATLREQAILDEIASAKKIQPLKYAQAVSNIALGVTKALSGLPPLSFIMAGLVAAAGAVEIATIRASSAQAGMDKRLTSDTLIMAHRGEDVKITPAGRVGGPSARIVFAPQYVFNYPVTPETRAWIRRDVAPALEADARRLLNNLRIRS